MTRAARTLTALMLALALGLILAPAGPVDAGPLDEAKAAGWVGERPDGYLGVVPGAPGHVPGLVQDINAKRRAKYQGIAEANGTSLASVEAVVGEKLIARAMPGEIVMNASGQWVRK